MSDRPEDTQARAEALIHIVARLAEDWSEGIVLDLAEAIRNAEAEWGMTAEEAGELVLKRTIN